MDLNPAIILRSISPPFHKIRVCDDEEGGDFVDGFALRVEVLQEGDVFVGWACGAEEGVCCVGVRGWGEVKGEGSGNIMKSPQWTGMRESTYRHYDCHFP